MSTMSSLNISISISIRKKLTLMLMLRLASLAHKLLMLMFMLMLVLLVRTGLYKTRLVEQLVLAHRSSPRLPDPFVLFGIFGIYDDI